MRDNPIASSRRNTPVQGQKITVNTQEANQRPLFSHLPVQCFNPTVIPQIGTNTLGPQEKECESREHSRKSPQNQIKGIRTPMSKQLPHQRSCQDVRMDPRYQKPPQYADILHHRPVPQTPIEINEIGPTIQQSMIQGPVQRDTQATGARSRRSMPLMNTQQTVSLPNLQIAENGGIREIDRLPEQEGDLNHNDYVLNCIHKNRPLTLNDVGRPVFVNHYYAGEAFIPVTSKKSQNSQITQQQNGIERGQVQRNGNNKALHSDLREDSQNSL